MFENPRGGRQARNFTTNAPKILDRKSSSEQIFSRKLPSGAPVSLPTTKIGDRFGRHQENPQQQQNPQRVFEYSQRLNLEKRELYPPPIRGNKLFCPKANTGTRSHLYKVKNGKMTFVLS